MLVSQVSNQVFHINKNDWNPKFIVVLKDQYDNTLTQSRSELQFDYWSDLLD